MENAEWKMENGKWEILKLKLMLPLEGRKNQTRQTPKFDSKTMI